MPLIKCHIVVIWMHVIDFEHLKFYPSYLQLQLKKGFENLKREPWLEVDP
jgi:hypothetical protein